MTFNCNVLFRHLASLHPLNLYESVGKDHKLTGKHYSRIKRNILSLIAADDILVWNGHCMYVTVSPTTDGKQSDVYWDAKFTYKDVKQI